MKKILIHTWTAYKCNGEYYLPYMHWVYLNEIVKYYKEVNLIIPVGKVYDVGDLVKVEFNNVKFIEIPFYSNYISAVRTFFHYIWGYLKLKDCDVVYSRYPAPFGWLQKVFFDKKDRIIHYVGDPIDAANNNPNFSKLKKITLITLFWTENKLFEWACKGAKVFANGTHISKKLKIKGIDATPLISSTLRNDDFVVNSMKKQNPAPKLIYVGYLRTAKGVETIINAFKMLLQDFPNSILSIVGNGEFENELKNIVQNFGIENQVFFYGFIDDRNRINALLRSHDVFCFASLSEGSPRVILEAMANGTNVVSTPVGSLPSIFTDNEDIMYANFNDGVDFYKKIKHLITNPKIMIKLRSKALQKVKCFTIESFISSIFNTQEGLVKLNKKSND